MDAINDLTATARSTGCCRRRMVPIRYGRMLVSAFTFYRGPRR